MRHFNIGKTTAVDYFNIMPGQQVLKILEMYARMNENQMNAIETWIDEGALRN